MTWPVTAFSRFWGVPEQQAVEVLDAIAMANVGNVQWQNDSKTIAKLSNRRIIRESEKRNRTKHVRAEAGKKGAAVRWQKCGPSESSLNPSLTPEDSLKKENHVRKPSADLSKMQKQKDQEDRIKQGWKTKIDLVSGRIYSTDKTIYARLFEWIGKKHKEHYPEAVILETLSRFEPWCKDKSINWWAWLDKVINTERAKYNARATELESEAHKRELTEISENVYGGQRLGQTEY